jgi:hypothetical protein
MALGWNLVSVNNNPLGAPGKTPLYSYPYGALHPFTRGTEMDTKKKKTDLQDFIRKRDSLPRGLQ